MSFAAILLVACPLLASLGHQNPPLRNHLIPLVLIAPSVIFYLGHAQPTDGLAHDDAFRQQHLSLTMLRKDLLGFAARSPSRSTTFERVILPFRAAAFKAVESPEPKYLLGI